MAITPLVFLAIYLCGGLTFLPLLFLIFLIYGYFAFPVVNISSGDGAGTVGMDNLTALRESHIRKAAHASEYPELRSHETHGAAGYFVVCREYVPGGVNGQPLERLSPGIPAVTVGGQSVYQTMYRTIFERNSPLAKSPNPVQARIGKARSLFYVVLRHGHLILYDDAEQLEVRHVISLSLYEIDIFGGGEPIPEAELWIKRNCIRLTPMGALENEERAAKSIFIFSDNCSEKEDLYFAMLQNAGDTSKSYGPPSPLRFETEHLVKLVQQLQASEENLQTRWANAIIGRLFLGLYKTPALENLIRKKITKKIARVPKPAFINDISLRKIELGDLAPFITNPKLKELTVDGDLTVEADIKYKGNFRIVISAIARIDLGSRFKAREVSLVLATILRQLEGHVLLRIKPPPSNRIWISFESPPKMEIAVEPIVSSRQITYGVILRAIKNRIREVVNETLVSPFWDDIPWTDTIFQQFRGGIWADEFTNAPDADCSSQSSGSLGSGTNYPLGPDVKVPRTESSVLTEDTRNLSTDNTLLHPESPETVVKKGDEALNDGRRAGPTSSDTSSASRFPPFTGSANLSEIEGRVGRHSDDRSTGVLHFKHSSTVKDQIIQNTAASTTRDPLNVRPASAVASEPIRNLMLDAVVSKTSRPLSSITSTDAPVPEDSCEPQSGIRLPQSGLPSTDNTQSSSYSLNSAASAARQWFMSRQKQRITRSATLKDVQTQETETNFCNKASDGETAAENTGMTIPSMTSESPVLSVGSLSHGSPLNPGSSGPRPLRSVTSPLLPNTGSVGSCRSLNDSSTSAGLKRRNPVRLGQMPRSDEELPLQHRFQSPSYAVMPDKESPKFDNSRVKTRQRSSSDNPTADPHKSESIRLPTSDGATKGVGEALLIVEAPEYDPSPPGSPTEHYSST